LTSRTAGKWLALWFWGDGGKFKSFVKKFVCQEEVVVALTSLHFIVLLDYSRIF
jgi:hypothetical protein